MSVIFNIADKVIFGDEAPDYFTFRKRVIADGGVVLDDEQLREDMLFVFRNRPSWFASPAVSKVGVLYGAPDLDGTVVRATVKTGVNADGVLGTRVANERPWSYVGGRIADLVEPSAVNQLFNSRDFANWEDGANITGSAEDVLGLTGRKMVVNTEGSLGSSLSTIFRTNSRTYTNGQIYTFSFIAKKTSSHGVFGYVVTGSVFGDLGSAFNVDTNTTEVRFSSANWTDRSRKITPLGGVYYLCEETATYVGTTATGNQSILLGVTDSISTSTQSIGNEGAFGAPQIETGSVATSRILTDSAHSTRNADVLTVTGAEGVIGQTEGSFLVEVDNSQLITPGLPRWILSINNFLWYFSGAANRIDVGRSGEGNFLDPSDFIVVGKMKMAFVYFGTTIQLYVNGVLAQQETSAVLPAFTGALNMGCRTPQLDQQFNNHIYNVALFKRALTEQEAIDLTSL